MADKHTWRASAEFTEALRAFRDLRREFIDTVVAVFNGQHPDNTVVWHQGLSVDPYPVGFKDGTKEVPPGLSRAQNRSHLIPVRGKAGDEWREALARMRKMPQMAGVFKRHGVHEFVLGDGAASSPGCFDGGDAFYFICSGDIAIDETPHLIPIKMSEYYAAKEKSESAGARP